MVSSQLLMRQTLLGSALPLGVSITSSTFSTFKVGWEDANRTWALLLKPTNYLVGTRPHTKECSHSADERTTAKAPQLVN